MLQKYNMTSGEAGEIPNLPADFPNFPVGKV